MAKLISKTYGEALFELAVEENKTDSFAEEVQGLSRIFAENKELEKFLNHPKIAKEEKIQVVENIFRGRLSDELTGFLKLILVKDRQAELPKILSYFTDKVKEWKKVGVAHVKTAIPLSEAQKQEILEKLLATTSYQEMEMHYQVDEALIGGMIVRIGDRVVDSSIRTKLEEMKRRLMKIQLA